MCLKTVKSRAKGGSSTVLTGYKIMAQLGNGKEYSNLFRFSSYLRGIWYRSKSTVLVGEIGSQYEPGFHIYPTLKDVQQDRNYDAAIDKDDNRYILVKVHYRGLLAKGAEWYDRGGTESRNVDVARYMKIIGKVRTKVNVCENLEH